MCRTALTWLFILFLFSSVSCQKKNATCEEITSKADKCMRDAILIGREDFAIIRSVQQLDDLVCSVFSENVRCISTLRRCLKPFPRSLFNLAMKNVRKAIGAAICGSNEVKKKFVETLSCLQTEEEAFELYNILDKVTAMIDHVSKESQVDDLIPHMCCGYLLTMDSAYVVAHDLCFERNGNATIEFVQDVVSSLFGDLIELGCGKYSSVQLCKTHIPDQMKLYYKIWNATVTRLPTTPIVPVLVVLDRLDSDINFN